MSYSNVRPLPPCPTTARPGTLAKLMVMRRRWWAGYALYHPGDEREVDPRPNGPAVDWTRFRETATSRQRLTVR